MASIKELIDNVRNLKPPSTRFSIFADDRLGNTGYTIIFGDRRIWTADIETCLQTMAREIRSDIDEMIAKEFRQREKEEEFKKNLNEKENWGFSIIFYDNNSGGVVGSISAQGFSNSVNAAYACDNIIKESRARYYQQNIFKIS